MNTYFHFINSLAGHNPFLDWLGVFFAVWAVWIMAGNYLLEWRKESPSMKYWHLLVLVATLGLIYAINFIIGFLWFEPRPYVAGNYNLLITEPWSIKSFPSDHAAIAFALAAATWRLNIKGWKKYRPWLGAVLVVLARVYVGVHYIHDVVVGALIGFFAVWFVSKIFDRYFNRLRQDL